MTLGHLVPLLMSGKAVKATALSMKFGDGLSTKAKDDWSRRAAECVQAMGSTRRTGLGIVGHQLAAAGRTSVDLAASVKGFYAPKLAEGRLT